MRHKKWKKGETQLTLFPEFTPFAGEHTRTEKTAKSPFITNFNKSIRRANRRKIPFTITSKTVTYPPLWGHLCAHTHVTSQGGGIAKHQRARKGSPQISVNEWKCHDQNISDFPQVNQQIKCKFSKIRILVGGNWLSLK